MKDCFLYSSIEGKQWIYRLKNRETKKTYDNISAENIQLNNKGIGKYEFIPTTVGEYSLLGSEVSFKTDQYNKDTSFTQGHIKLDFTVIK